MLRPGGPLTPARAGECAPSQMETSETLHPNRLSAATSTSRKTSLVSQNVMCSRQNWDLTPRWVSSQGLHSSTGLHGGPVAVSGSQQPSVTPAVCQEPSLVIDAPL